MADAPPPTMRWPLAAGLVLVLVVALLIGGVILARRIQLAESLASPTVVASTVTRSSAATATSVVLVTPAATRAPAAAATTVSRPTSNGTPSATQVTQFSIVLVNGTPQVLAAGASPQLEPTPREWWNQVNSISDAQGSELNNAYLHFWQVRARALFDLDPSPLRQVMDGPALQREQAAIDAMRARNQSEQIDVEHHAEVQHATDDDATIIDNYVSSTVAVDLDTNETLTPTPRTTWHLAYHLRKLSGTWKVVEAVQLDI